jgi:hypothetical protein
MELLEIEDNRIVTHSKDDLVAATPPPVEKKCARRGQERNEKQSRNEGEYELHARHKSRRPLELQYNANKMERSVNAVLGERRSFKWLGGLATASPVDGLTV